MQSVTSRREFVGALTTGAAGLAVAGRFAPGAEFGGILCTSFFVEGGRQTALGDRP